jgi:hypothetical protein
MFTVTLIKDFVKVVDYLPFEEFLNRVKSGAYAHLIKAIRAKINDGDQKGADALKRLLPAIASSGKFDGKRCGENNTEYSHLVVLDIDKLTDEQLLPLKQKICACPHTLACFVSPSGRGLKVFVCVSTDAKDHLKAFLALQQYYQKLTGVKIDASGKDIARLCFVSYDPQLYHNPGAAIFNPMTGTTGVPFHEPTLRNSTQFSPTAETTDADQTGNPEPPVKAEPLDVNKTTGEIIPQSIPKPQSPALKKNITQTYQKCIAMTERKFRFIDGQRNVFVYNLAVRMRYEGFSEMLTTMLLLQDFNYVEKEVRNSIKSAYGYNWIKDSEDNSQPADDENASPPSSGEESTETNSPPDGEAVPSPEKKKKSRPKYVLKIVEKMLYNWYDTRYNEVTGMIEWRDLTSSGPYERLLDHHENSMFRRLHHAHQLIPLNTLHALLNSDYSPTFNPFHDYFNKLKPWDGTTDYIGQLINTVKTKDDAYWAFCFRKWFVAYAASMISDSIINHTVLVLVGDQGIGKTSWLRLLLPLALIEYLGTTALQADSKDTAIQLGECGMIIFDELETLNKKDLASLKELITRSSIHVRRPYGRNFETLIRHASFAASVNFEQVLTDPSGTRRYLCSHTLDIDYKHTVDIDGAMAQALALYKSGFCFWFDQVEIRELQVHNSDFISKSIEEEVIETWFRPVSRAEWKTRHQFVNGHNIQLMTTTEIANKVVEKAKINLCDNTIVKIGKIMVKLGYERIRKGNNYVYMLRMVDGESIERENHTLNDEEPDKSSQQDPNDKKQPDNDLFTSQPETDQPF